MQTARKTNRKQKRDKQNHTKETNRKTDKKKARIEGLMRDRKEITFVIKRQHKTQKL